MWKAKGVLLRNRNLKPEAYFCSDIVMKHCKLNEFKWPIHICLKGYCHLLRDWMIAKCFRKLIQTVLYPSAVFDLHFIPGTQTFAIVSSTGTLAIFRLTEKESTNVPNIETVATHEVFKDDVAPTYFTWAPRSGHSMAVTTSDGGIYFVRLSQDYKRFEILNNSEPVLRHSEYAWCCAFTPDLRYIYSGGDDSKLRIEKAGISLAELNSEQELEPSGLWSRGIPGHDAGVTFILPLPIEKADGGPEVLLTGSYDDRIRIISISEYPARPKVLLDFYLGGGVWRLKIMDSTPASPSFKTNEVIRFTVLASCMHAGSKILSVCGSKVDIGDTREWKWEITVLADMRLHKSMNYASDVQLLNIGEPERAEKRKRICVSSSFYDRLLCVWSWDPEK